MEHEQGKGMISQTSKRRAGHKVTGTKLMVQGPN